MNNHNEYIICMFMVIMCTQLDLFIVNKEVFIENRLMRIQ